MKILQPFRGASCLLKGCGLLLQPGIRHYIIVPILINFAVFSGFTILGISQASQLIQAILPQLPEWLQWLEWLIWPVFLLSFLAIGFLISLMVANLVAAPINGFLAEAIEKQLAEGHLPEKANNRPIMLQAIGDLKNEVKKIGYFLLRAVPLLVLFVIPGVNLVAPFVWLLFSAWMLALEYADYPFANHHIPFAEIRRRLKQQRMLTLGFGLAALLWSIIPVLNFFIMPVAVAGATVMYLQYFTVAEQ